MIDENDVLQVLCRVFDDGADQGMAEWRAWYRPAAWLNKSRALGAFIHTRLAVGRVSPTVDSSRAQPMRFNEVEKY